MNVYVASKAKHGPMWIALKSEFSSLGLMINSTWINESGTGQSGSLPDLWMRCISEARKADALIAYHEDGDQWKGAFVEIGAALAHAVPVFVVGNPPGSWVNHPWVYRASSIMDAARRIAG